MEVIKLMDLIYINDGHTDLINQTKLPAIVGFFREDHKRRDFK